MTFNQSLNKLKNNAADLVKQASASYQNSLNQIGNIRQAALTKVNQITSQLTFQTGQKVHVELTKHQQQQLENVKTVSVELNSDKLIIRPASIKIFSQTLTDSNKAFLFNQALQHSESETPKGNIVLAKISNNQARFEFDGRVYQIPVSAKLAKQQSVYLQVNQTNNGLSVKVINTNEKPIIAPFELQTKISNGFLHISNDKIQLPKSLASLITGSYTASLKTQGSSRHNPERMIELINNQTKEIHKLNLNKLNNSFVDALITKLIPKQGNHLIKTIQIHDQEINIKLAGQKVKIALEDLKQANTAAQSQLANVKLAHNQVELKLANGQKFHFVMDEIPSIKNLIEQQNNQVAKQNSNITQVLEKLNVSLLPEHREALKQLNSLAGLRLNLENKNLVLSQQPHTSISVPMSAKLKNDLQQSGLINAPTKENTVKLNPDIQNTHQENLSSSQTQLFEKFDPKLSEQSLLKQLNQTSLISDKQILELSASSKSQLNQQLKHQVGQIRPLNELFSQLQAQVTEQQNAELISAAPKPNESVTKAIRSLLNQFTQLHNAEQIQQIVQSQINMPQSLTSQTNPTGLSNQLALALQLLLKPKTSRNYNKETTTSAKTNKPHLSPEGSLTLKALAQSLKHIQHNQQQTALSKTESHAQIFATIPFGANSKVEQAEVKINLEQHEDELSNQDKALSMWKFSVKFDLEALGKMVTKASLFENELRLNLYCENPKLAIIAEDKISHLRKKLAESGIQLNEVEYNCAKIAEHLWQETSLQGFYSK
ncbi:flagellar hook-length control protein FliK [Catenovulum maritimum]|uniref:Flagellar hook-length control protein-like C-terminal domain-containing protein n=1 Tax=Catenovulum maritimum TaxID=1513271 RepID=A0A0J8JNY4_9ALTE|nr:flagellar hook-length control protein FliK [Catenovulum maritimum]KMT66351.1 hypothetical protein XM47_03710 [Catenovulum maritimum]